MTVRQQLPMPEDEQDAIRSWLTTRDEAAAAWLVERYYPIVLGIARRHAGWRTGEADLAQEVFLHVFAALPRYDPARPFENWLARITLNTCYQHLRAQRCRPELRWSDLSPEQRAALAEGGAGKGETLDGREAREILDRLLATLPATDQLIFRLWHLEEKSVAEIRELTGWSAVLVRVRAHRARKKMQQLLRRLHRL